MMRVSHVKVREMNRIELAKRIAASRLSLNTAMDEHMVTSVIKYPHVPTFSTGELLDHQIDHVNRLNHIISTKGSAGDTTPPGGGKTYTGAAVARRQCLPVMVFCTKSGISMWWKVLRMWGVPVVTVTNYDMARSSHSDSIVKWYDMRDGYTDTATICPWIVKDKVRKRVSIGCKEAIRFTWNLPYKCLIIFDEEHAGKNTHTQTFSFIKGAVQASKRYGHKLLYLSATPIEKKVNLKSIMYFLGLITQPCMIAVNTYFKEKIGSTDMTDVHRYLYSVDPEACTHMGACGCTGSMSSMPAAKFPTGIINDVRPIAFPMTEEVTRQIAAKNKEILLLRERLRERVYDNTLGSINANRRFIETYKIDKAEELAIAGIRGTFPIDDTFRQFKRVAIFTNYKSTLHTLYDRLSSCTALVDGVERPLGPLISLLHGDQSKQESDSAALDYNEGRTRILISTIRKGGLSLSFHDTVGDKETLVIIFPPTSATDLCQCIGRTFRTNTKSPVTQVILFTMGDQVEESIREALQIKLRAILNFTTGADCEFDLHDLVDQRIICT